MGPCCGGRGRAAAACSPHCSSLCPLWPWPVSRIQRVPCPGAWPWSDHPHPESWGSNVIIGSPSLENLESLIFIKNWRRQTDKTVTNQTEDKQECYVSAESIVEMNVSNEAWFHVLSEKNENHQFIYENNIRCGFTKKNCTMKYAFFTFPFYSLCPPINLRKDIENK